MKMLYFRRICQLLFFSAFLIFFLLGLPFLFQTNVLALIITFISSRYFNLILLIPGVAIVLLTLVFSRIFCGWICPLGTVFDSLYFLSFKSKKLLKFYNLKYYILIFIIAGAVVGVQYYWWFEPVTKPFKTLTSFTVGLKHLFSYPAYFIFIALFLISIGLNLIHRRFFCKLLCPLGAVYTILSKFGIYKVFISIDGCTKCGKCYKTCPTDAIDSTKLVINNTECVNCFLCHAKCSVKTIKFGRFKSDTTFSYSKRYLITSLLSGVITGVGLKYIKPKTIDRRLIRPPGVFNNDKFVSSCIRCGQCVQTCPTHGLMPATGTINTILTPKLVPRIGFCAYNCNQCGKTCPTGAIPNLKLAEKKRAVMGVAVFNYDRCVLCLTCEEMCPIPEKAIKTREENRKVVPYLEPELCIGCGICENKCPVVGEAAIRVYRTNY